MERYDVIVIGCGGVGSAALYHLAKRGARVLGIDRFNPPHDRGSSHGQTRVIRQAYFEHPNYVPLLRESYRLWHDLESLAGDQLFHQVGLIEIGPADGVVVSGVLRAAEEHHLSIESLAAADIEKRWPGLRVGAELVGVFEPTAGYLCVEKCVQAHLDAARAAGADVLFDVNILDWTADDGGIRMQTSSGVIQGERLVIAAGAWAGKLLNELNVKLTVLRKSLFWFASDRKEYAVESGLPVFLFELPGATRGRVSPILGNGSLGETAPRGVFYGFPKLDTRGVKFAEHSGGQIVGDPLAVDRAIDLEEQRRLVAVLSKHLPGVSGRVTDHTVCLYTMSPDEHFIVDRHPTLPNTVFAAGLSGHAFKFTPVLGKALADISLDGGTEMPIGFLSLNRFKQ